ncbi:hypothetical protein SNEBB_000859 [Seison nebaliae]|nr:hypothetical protein SNEBB_000859 [Seison nebaliae]
MIPITAITSIPSTVIQDVNHNDRERFEELRAFAKSLQSNDDDPLTTMIKMDINFYNFSLTPNLETPINLWNELYFQEYFRIKDNEFITNPKRRKHSILVECVEQFNTEFFAHINKIRPIFTTVCTNHYKHRLKYFLKDKKLSVNKNDVEKLDMQIEVLEKKQNELIGKCQEMERRIRLVQNYFQNENCSK